MARSISDPMHAFLVGAVSQLLREGMKSEAEVSLVHIADPERHDESLVTDTVAMKWLGKGWTITVEAEG